MAIYMKYDGVDGVVTAAGHEKWIELNSFAWADSRNIQSQAGRTTNREATAPRIEDIVITKDLDEATTLLVSESLVGEGKKVTIEFVRTDAKLETFLKYVLDNVVISKYAITAAAHDRPTEQLSLCFTKIEISFMGSDIKNKAKGGLRVAYDVSQAKLV
jgi:type VI secretion system secreted protein Hcp